MEQDDKTIDEEATRVCEGIRDNLLYPMHDSINTNTTKVVNEKADYIINKLVEVIEKKMTAEEIHWKSLIKALSNLKWDV